MKNNQINIFTQSSTSTDDLLEMDLKLKLPNRIHESRSNMTHPTNQKLYDTLYESVYLDHDALNAQYAEPSFHNRSHDNQDSPNNREGENKKKHRKDVSEPSSRSSRQNKSLVQYQNDVELEYHVDQLKAAVLTEAKWNSDEDEVRSDDKEYEFSYADLPRLSLNDVDDMYLLEVQDKLHHLSLEFMIDFNNALLLFIRRVVIQNRLSEVKKFCDGTLEKIRENLIDMVKIKNKLCTDNKRLKGRDWIDMDVKKSNKMVDKIDKVLKHREQLKRLKTYVRERPKTVNLCTFVRPV
ncbi:hypothetical protein Tco_1230505 [Tanacetum coccineum]